MSNNKDLMPKDISKFLEIQEKELEIRKEEIALKKEQLQARKEIELKAMEQSDKENDKNFEAFRLTHKEEAKNNRLLRIIAIVSLVSIVITMGFSFYLIKLNNPFGEKILWLIIGIVGGGLGGWGISKRKQKKEN